MDGIEKSKAGSSDGSSDADPDVNSYLHIEQGEVNCGGPDGWDNGSWGSKYHTVYFTRSYSRPPLVHVSVWDFKAETSGKYVRLTAWSQRVKSDHMSVVCFKDKDSGTIQIMKVNWISFPQ